MGAEKAYENIYGRIDSVIFRSDDTGYAVLRVDIGEEDLVTVVGCIPYASPYSSSGGWPLWAGHLHSVRLMSVKVARKEEASGEQA